MVQGMASLFSFGRKVYIVVSFSWFDYAVSDVQAWKAPLLPPKERVEKGRKAFLHPEGRSDLQEALSAFQPRIGFEAKARGGASQEGDLAPCACWRRSVEARLAVSAFPVSSFFLWWFFLWIGRLSLMVAAFRWLL